MSTPAFLWNRTVAGLLLAGISLAVNAQDKFPSRPVRIVVPWAAGTPPDVAARAVAAKLPELLKQPVVIENRPGASGTLGLGEVARAPADGYTIGALHYATATVASLYPQMKFDLVKDLTGIGQIEWGHNVLVVSPSLGVNSVPELIEHLRRTPASYASSGVGTPAHLSGLMFQRATGIEATHVPYRGIAPAINDLQGGHVEFIVAGTASALPLVRGGTAKPLAILSKSRSALLPQVPTAVEQGVNTESAGWYGVLAPAGTPEDILQKLSNTLVAAVATPEFRERLQSLAGDPQGSNAAQFGQFIKAETQRFGTLISTQGIQLQ